MQRALVALHNMETQCGSLHCCLSRQQWVSSPLPHREIQLLPFAWIQLLLLLLCIMESIPHCDSSYPMPCVKNTLNWNTPSRTSCQLSLHANVSWWFLQEQLKSNPPYPFLSPSWQLLAQKKSRKKTKVSQNLRIFRTCFKTPATSSNQGVAWAIKNEKTTRQPNLQS